MWCCAIYDLQGNEIASIDDTRVVTDAKGVRVGQYDKYFGIDNISYYEGRSDDDGWVFEKDPTEVAMAKINGNNYVPEYVVIKCEDGNIYYGDGFSNIIGRYHGSKTGGSIAAFICLKEGRFGYDLGPLFPPKKQHDEPKSNKGCYIATAVYGTYDCPEVWTLRRFRDQFLSKYFCGRAFISIYYVISPKLIKMFGNTEAFNCFWQCRLDALVQKLSSKGFEGMPYNDND